MMIKMKRKLAIDITLLIMSLVVIFALFEVSVRSIYGKHIFYEGDKELYWKLAPSQEGYQVLGFPKATINKDGFRGKELEINRKNVIVLGASNVFGKNVEDNETFSFLLEKRLNEINEDYQIINMGVPGWGLFQEKIQLERNYEKYNPEVVILLVSKGILERQKFKDKHKEKMFLTKIKIRSYFKDVASTSFLNQMWGLVFSHYFFSATENYIKNQSISELWESERKKLEDIYALLDENNIPFILVEYHYNSEEFSELVKKFAAGKNIVLINNLDKYLEVYPREKLRISETDGHPSPLAHKIIAERLFIEIENNGLI